MWAEHGVEGARPCQGGGARRGRTRRADRRRTGGRDPGGAAEALSRENRRLKRLLCDAKLELPAACVEDVDYPPHRKLDKKVVQQLATCRWVQQAQVVTSIGATGTGKTYLACALANQACGRGYKAICRRASRLFDELALSRADGSYPRLLTRIARTDVLILDDWGMSPIRDAERCDMLEVLDDRHGIRATIMTSQVPPGKWNDLAGDPTTADAIWDRLLHGAHRLQIKGPSRRKTATT